MVLYCWIQFLLIQAVATATVAADIDASSYPSFAELLQTSKNVNWLSGYHRFNSRQPLTPADLPPLSIFSNFSGGHHETVHIISNEQQTSVSLNVSTGYIRQAASTQHYDAEGHRGQSEVSVLWNLLNRDEVSEILKLAQSVPQLDTDPDTVDGFVSQEFFVDNEELRRGQVPGKEGAENYKQRKAIRQKLQAILMPVLQERLIPYIRHHYPGLCSTHPDRLCQACYSLIRRYRHDARQSHAPHHDGHALVTAVTSLSDYGDEYTGGLYVATETGQPQFLPLRRGDTAVHTSDLLHGVKVYPATDAAETKLERWSWIVWLTDSTTCETDHGDEWFAECANKGNPTCQMLQATKVKLGEGITKAQSRELNRKWNLRAANNGHPTSCVKMARAYMGLLPPIPVAKNMELAREYFERAILSANDPDGHYGLATVMLEEIYDRGITSVEAIPRQIDTVVAHLEAAAYGGHPFAMFNLGIVHTLGYGTHTVKDFALAGEWYELSGLPEGLFMRALQLRTVEETRAVQLRDRAISLGFGAEWRKMTREMTGYGGAGGINLNLKWPATKDGEKPPEY